jgi:hypothetical protein
MVLTALPSAMAQYDKAAVAALISDDVGTVLGQPLAIVEKISDVTPLVDGAKITKLNEELKWRDSQGRFRRETTRVVEGTEPVYHMATIIDPIKNTITTLNMDRKTARVVHLQQGQLRPYTELDNRVHLALPGGKVKVEKLDGKTIAGVYAVGIRVTRTWPPGTADNDKMLVSVGERWVSPDSKVLLASSLDDPRGQLTSEVTQLSRGEPDASLFEIPADYTVKEAMGLPIPGR